MVEHFAVTGGARLDGAVDVVGAKNSVLKLMAAALLAEGTTVLTNCPGILDVLVERHGLAEQLLLAAERRVEAGRADAHGGREVAHGRALVAVLPEDLHGAAQCLGAVEPARTSPVGHGPSFL